MLPDSPTMLAVAVAAALAGTIQAGSLSFQPALTTRQTYSLRSNVSSTHQKRWLAPIMGGTGIFDPHLWPDKTVTYAWDDDGFRAIMSPEVSLALDMWDAMNLKKDEFKWKRVEKADCLANRPNCLLIIEKRNTFKSTVGIPPVDPDTPGPMMHIDFEPHVNWPMEVIIAHEIGHVWGLQHEHQNPAFWAKEFLEPRRTTFRDGRVFSAANFPCESFPDYQAKLALAKDTTRPNYDATDADMLCRRRGVAKRLGFSAASFMPLQGRVYSAKADLSQGPEDVDWDSVMIYSTDMWANTMPGLKLLTKPDGTDIPAPKGPSNLDVIGIQLMYSARDQLSTAGETLLNAPGNSHQGTFKKMFCGCCGVGGDSD